MSLIHVDSRKQLEQIVTALHKGNKHWLVVLYFHTPSDRRCSPVDRIFQDANAKYNDDNMLFLFIDTETHENSGIVDLFHVEQVPYCVILRDGYILQKLAYADLQAFLVTLDECAPIIYNLHADDNRTEQQEHQQKQVGDSENQLGIERLVNAAPVMLFIKGTPSKPKCRFSKQAVELVRASGVRFGFFDVLRNATVRDLVKEHADWPTIPIVYVNGEFQGGLDILRENLAEDPQYFQKRI
ncbi:monothiol glutaredoxin GRX4 KNAG_0G01920 [Huiozyma naganishii CBS 8797]|uniref:Glutaredoxin domain-containing protein n=1 Tax=Huiozyma naganishii (strain ATCC MYA-139 / BCRC 22969 / CBS 8797 / KCTC 17520 / NBRC 10181 / NCYC 3082 / Yp74L-3) TaxID=1071383 RepID=J7S7Y7_HUIN7|nr:hypothetical protein KNAG_0G01920 [Kazachstania naganishii CBS 8797]CCK71249.1 hypothetical protein KNAG_0G01920 [Kazachstania naganishii CBS 8797]